MPIWTFYEFIEINGGSPFADWMASDVPVEAQAVIDARILQMSGLLRWPEKWISKYRGTEKIFELRVTFMKVQYRPFGVYAPNRSFILVGGGIEKGRIPRAVIDAVEKRQRTLETKGITNHVRRYRFN